MSRPYPNRRRKRPGRRPPHRYQGRRRGWPDGYMDFGARHLYDLLFPGIRGRDRRQAFNLVSLVFVAAAGLMAASMGFRAGGLPGAMLGGIAASAYVGHCLWKNRFFR